MNREALLQDSPRCTLYLLPSSCNSIHTSPSPKPPWRSASTARHSSPLPSPRNINGYADGRAQPSNRTVTPSPGKWTHLGPVQEASSRTAASPLLPPSLVWTRFAASLCLPSHSPIPPAFHNPSASQFMQECLAEGATCVRGCAAICKSFVRSVSQLSILISMRRADATEVIRTLPNPDGRGRGPARRTKDKLCSCMQPATRMSAVASPFSRHTTSHSPLSLSLSTPFCWLRRRCQPCGSTVSTDAAHLVAVILRARFCRPRSYELLSSGRLLA